MAFAHRVARREDLPQIVAIYNATIPSRLVTADLESVSVASRVRWFEEHSPDFRPLWVVDAEGQVAGWLSFSSFYGRPAYNRTAELSVYVHAEFRKRGIASYLLTQHSRRHRLSVSIPCWDSYRPQPAQPGVVRKVRLRALGRAAEVRC